MIEATDPGKTRSVRVTGLRRAFAGNVILDDLNLTLHPGEFVALLGRSGSGKTTLLRVLAGLDRADAGEIQAPSQRAVVFQEPRLFPWRRVWRNVIFGLEAGATRAAAFAALNEVELGHRIDAWPLTLSGGEAQRAALARALVREPKLLLLDEPFAALDALTRIRMQGLVAQLWHRHQPAVMLVTHDVDEAVLLADRVLVLESGRIKSEITIPLTRSRNPLDPEFARLRARLLAELGVVYGQHSLNSPIPRVQAIA